MSIELRIPLSSNHICHSHHNLDISGDQILAAANQVVSLGLQDAGYEYINIDVQFLYFTLKDVHLSCFRTVGR